MSSGKDYLLPLFRQLTRAPCAERVVFYDWGTRPDRRPRLSPRLVQDRDAPELVLRTPVPRTSRPAG